VKAFRGRAQSVGPTSLSETISLNLIGKQILRSGKITKIRSD